jgi:hypothetical protein
MIMSGFCDIFSRQSSPVANVGMADSVLCAKSISKDFNPTYFSNFVKDTNTTI